MPQAGGQWRVAATGSVGALIAGWGWGDGGPDGHWKLCGLMPSSLILLESTEATPGYVCQDHLVQPGPGK